MGVTVEVTYDMSKALGTRRFELDGVRTVGEILERTRERFGSGDRETCEKLLRACLLSVNGVLITHRNGMSTPVADGDLVCFVKTAAGG